MNAHGTLSLGLRSHSGSAFGLAAAGMLLAAQGALAVDRLVPSQYPNIQAAMTAAVNGDRIVLANGTYTGASNRNVDFGAKNVMVVSASGNPATCIIDLQNAGRAFYIVSNQTASAGVSGVTIRNGNASLTNTDQGGAIFMGYHGQTRCTIHNCVFENNRGDKGGALAAYTNGTSPTISNCVFRNNSVVAYGGAILSDSNASPSIVNCLFIGNSSTGGFGPGGAVGTFGGSPIVQNCTFTGNSATHGSAVSFEFGNALMSNCILWDNPNGDLNLASGDVINSIVADFSLTPTPDIFGNFSANPLFVNAGAGNYHLQAASPAINRGTANGITCPPFPGVGGAPMDLDGAGRICGSAPDLGVYETGGCQPIPNDICSIATLLNDGTVAGTLAGSGRDMTPSCQNAGTVGDLWYRYVPAINTTLRINTCGSAVDTVLSLYSGACGSLSEVACNNNAGAGSPCSSQPNAAAIAAPVLAGTTYFIRVSANGSVAGNFSLTLAADAASGDIVNGSFELGTFAGAQPVGSTDITGWVVTRGGVDWTEIWQDADGNRSVDLQGLNSSGGVMQTLGTVPGQRYRLTFALAGNPDSGPAVKHMAVRAGSTNADFSFDTTGRTRTNMGWTDRSIFFVAASSSTQIELYSTDAPNSWGAVVDNVRVVEDDNACQADFNVDGVVNSGDLFAYLAAFFSGSIIADFDHSGAVNSADFFAFLGAFFAGC